jgi:predicted transcriptional regulator
LHLKNLKKIGFVKFDSIENGNFKYQYTGKEGEPQTVKKYRTLTKNVFDYMKKVQSAVCKNIVHGVGYEHWNITKILAGLERQGFLEKVGPFPKKDIHSRVEITDLGIRFLEEYVTVFEDALSDGNSLQLLENKAWQFFEDRSRAGEYLSKGIENYWKVSPRVNARPIEETNSRIIAYLEKNPGARSKDIKDNIGLSLTNTYVSPLLRAGILEKRHVNGEKRTNIGYFVKR